MDLDALRQQIEQARAAAGVPGVAVALIRGDETLLADGFGLRDVARQLPMTADTLLAIGSCSKAFTAAALAMLADEGRLTWDTPVVDLLPDFRLHDPVAGARATVRDMLSHQTGLPGHDFMWYQFDGDRELLYRRLAHLPPSADLRQTWQYQNLVYSAAGYLVGRLTGGTWEQFVAGRIFDPLGMGRSNFSVDASQRDDDHALPYEQAGETLQRMAFANIDNIGPAGSINSSVNELIPWLRLQLNQGRHGEQQLISAARLADMHFPQVVIPDQTRSSFYGADFITYGLGWIIQTHRGRRLVWHSGGIDGFVANVAFLPDLQVGIAVMANLNVTRLVPAVTFTIVDALLDVDQRDWFAHFDDVGAQLRQMEADAAGRLDAARVPDTAPGRPLADYAGTYVHPGYGAMTISLEEGTLYKTFNGQRQPLDHYHFDSFSAIFEIEMRRPRLTLTFEPGADGRVSRLLVPFEPQLDPIPFTRQKPPTPESTPTGETPMARTYPPIFDGHNDTILNLHLEARGQGRSFFQRSDVGHVDLPRAREGGLGGGFFALFVPARVKKNKKRKQLKFPGEDDAPEDGPISYRVPLPKRLKHKYAINFALALMDRLYAVEKEAAGAARIVRSADELAACLENGTLGMILHFEGAEAIDEELHALPVFYRAGLRSLGLVWSRSNRFGHGVPFEFPGDPDIGDGLTAAGKALVARCNELGILVDLSHLNEKGFWNVAAISDAPLVATHSGVHAICPTPRNLTDRQLEAIAKSNGIVGVNFHVGFLRPDGRLDRETGVDAIADHVDYIVRHIGLDHVAFGSDFDGAQMPDDMKDAAGLPLLMAELARRGYDDAALTKIAHGNWLRVLRATWK